MREAPLPFVSIITVNYNGIFFLKKLFDSINNLNYPRDKFQVIMVDNASKDGSIDFVRKNYPFVEILTLEKNLGFAGGNNAGVKLARGDYIAFINNDCVVEREWLINMLLSLRQKEKEGLKIGGVGSKVYFYFKYIPVRIVMEDLSPQKNESDKENGYYGIIRQLRIKDESIYQDTGNKADDKIDSRNLLKFANNSFKYVNGFFDLQKDLNKNIIRKIKREALIAVPVVETGKDLSLEIEMAFLKPDTNLRILCESEEIFNLQGNDFYGNEEALINKGIYEGNNHKDLNINKNSESKTGISKNDVKKSIGSLLFRKFDLKIPEKKIVHAKDMINSCGSMINKSFYAREIGYESIEENISDEPSEVFAVPGSSFMVKKEVIYETKLFDAKFFTYYEDIDFFWRARLKGWRFFVEPRSIARHFHCGSGQEWSYSFTYHVLRNRLLMIYKCGWPLGFLKNYLSFCTAALINFVYLIISKLKGKSLDKIDIMIRVKIFFEFFILMVCFLGQRINVRRGSIVSDKEIKAWQKNF
ncbi:glycosyltransferase family 2 protein [bacterium]|nr:glycosyltransferase family 2 protein [bacterium]